MERISTNKSDNRTLMGQLTGRYGALALTRAAGAAAAAERRGDREQTAMWKSVVADLRREMGSAI